MSARWWCGQFWGNSPSSDVDEALAAKRGTEWVLEIPEIEAWSAQIEKGEEEGHMHLQWCAKFSHGRDYKWVLNKLGMNNGHGSARPCKDAKAAWAYTQKEDTRVDGPWTFGSGPVRATKRSREFTNEETREILSRMAADPTKTVRDLSAALNANAYSSAVLKKCLEVEREAACVPYSGMPDLYWRWGDTGSGKTS